MNRSHHPTALQMIPVDQIVVLNPRDRNGRVFEEIVGNIKKIGLKKPVTVTPRDDLEDGKRFDVPEAFEDGFSMVQLKALTFLSPDGALKLECTAMQSSQQRSVHELLKEKLNGPLEGNWTVTAAQVNLYYPPEPGRTRAKVVTIEVSPRETVALAVLGKVVKPTVVDQSFVLCPHCQQHRAQVWGDGRGGRMCRCPDCGPVAVEVNDGAALALDEEWLRTKMRLALDIESRDGIDDLGGGVWRLGDARRSPVVLARDLTRVLHEPALLNRVRVAGGDTRVITPRPSTTRGSPFGTGVEWLVLEERFALYGGAISFIATSPSAMPAVDDPATPVYGPFSADFKWATLPDISSAPIQFTDGQAKVFESLWSFKGEATTADRIMPRAGLDSAKPSDLFKIKTKDKGKPGPEAQHAAYGALVVTQQRAGLYAMPCAAAGKEVAMT